MLLIRLAPGFSLYLQWRHSQIIPIPIKHHIFAQSLRSATLLDPLTPPGAYPQTLQEPNRAVLGVREVMAAHNWLDSLGGFVGVVERNGRNIVMQDVGFDDAVE